jgi:multiple sugar transport system ATP-binding protein
MAKITLDAVAKRFDDGTEALQPTSLQIDDGELFVLVGPSGCGKSTLLRLIVGLERPTAGRILVDGEDMTRRDPKDRNMAMVFQSYALYPHLNVRDNLAFPLRLARLPDAEIASRVDETAGTLGLRDLLERRPAALSGGQRQRVAMGRAIIRRPTAFLLDEPLSNLDAKLRGSMRAELSRMQRRLGTTMIYVTHDQTEAMTLGQRIALLRDGRLQQVGTPRELYQTPRNLFVAGFIGSPPMNLIPARHVGDRLQCPMGDLVLPEAHASKGAVPREVIAGVRPEQLRPAEPSDSDSFIVKAEVVEWLGADLLLHCVAERADRASGERNVLVARLDAAHRVQPGDQVTLAVDAAGILLFDPSNGTRIDDTASR